MAKKRHAGPSRWHREPVVDPPAVIAAGLASAGRRCRRRTLGMQRLPPGCFGGHSAETGGKRCILVPAYAGPAAP
jgi:hypothetical protein